MRRKPRLLAGYYTMGGPNAKGTGESPGNRTRIGHSSLEYQI